MTVNGATDELSADEVMAADSIALGMPFILGGNGASITTSTVSSGRARPWGYR